MTDTAALEWMKGNPFINSQWFEHVAARLPDFTEHRLQDMDEHGIDIQVLSLTTPGVQGQPDPGLAVQEAKRANDFLAGVVAENPDRFGGFAALPLQDPQAAVGELARAVEDLGLHGALVNGSTLGHYLDEPQFAPVWAELERLDVPLYLHPNDESARDPWAVLDGYPELGGAMYRWNADTGAHAMRIVLSGIFDRHPGVKLILGHMGELLPFQLFRLDSRYKFANSHPLEHLPSHYIRNNILATTSGTFDVPALLGAVAAIGVDNILFSVDYPYEHTAEAVAFLDRLPLAPADLAKIAHKNAERVLKIAPTTE
ncbi:amidohydrolase family protein [Mycobacteroides abscessus]|nr:amidohydrolase family protein [Mycobacteroides abscessus]